MKQVIHTNSEAETSAPDFSLTPMRLLGSSLLLAVALFNLSCGLSYADDVSARRYGVFDHDDVVYKFLLLATPEVQGCLSVTTQQVQALKAVFTASADSIPGVKDLRQRVRATLNTTNPTEAEASRVRAENRTLVRGLFHDYESNELGRILTDSQKARLNELFRQMKGPRILLEGKDEASQIDLKEWQRVRMAQIITSYGPMLSLLENRYAELQINTVRRNRSAVSIDQELASIECVVHEIEKDRDHQLLATLDANQQAKWFSSIGTLLPIDWHAEKMIEVPFSAGEKE